MIFLSYGANPVTSLITDLTKAVLLESLPFLYEGLATLANLVTAWPFVSFFAFLGAFPGFAIYNHVLLRGLGIEIGWKGSFGEVDGGLFVCGLGVRVLSGLQYGC